MPRCGRARCTSFNAFFGPMPLIASLKSVPTRIARSTSLSRLMPSLEQRVEDDRSGTIGRNVPWLGRNSLPGNRQEAHQPGAPKSSES
jgi:hypothetical protein